LLDGLKSYECVFGENEFRSSEKNRVLKEEPNTSHVCQGYDQQVAKEDKKNAAEFLYETRKMQQQQTAKAIIDQYALVLIGIRIVKQCKKETWISSFVRVNLHPTYRLVVHCTFHNYFFKKPPVCPNEEITLENCINACFHVRPGSISLMIPITSFLLAPSLHRS